MVNLKKNEQLKQQIKTRYETEDTEELARDLGITPAYLRVLAKRLNLKKGIRSITNAIINNEKLCPCCNKMLPVEEFNKDKYQPNNLDYYCRSCRSIKKHKICEPNIIIPKLKEIIENKPNIKESKRSKDILYKKTRNPIILVDNVKSLRCKECGEIKPLSQFHKDKANISGHKNFCKLCISKR